MYNQLTRVAWRCVFSDDIDVNGAHFPRLIAAVRFTDIMRRVPINRAWIFCLSTFCSRIHALSLSLPTVLNRPDIKSILLSLRKKSTTVQDSSLSREEIVVKRDQYSRKVSNHFHERSRRQSSTVAETWINS